MPHRGFREGAVPTITLVSRRLVYEGDDDLPFERASRQDLCGTVRNVFNCDAVAAHQRRVLRRTPDRPQAAVLLA